GPIENARQFSISTLWILYAATTLALGVLRRSALLRWGGLVLLLAAIGKVVALDSSFYAAWWHLPVFNLTFMVYVLLVAVLAFAGLSLEVLGYYDRLLTGAELAGSGTEMVSRFQEGRIFTLALVWILY